MKKNDMNNYKDSKLFSLINNILFKKINCKCKLLYVSSPGSSPSKVYMFKDENNKMYAIKICDTNIARVSLFKEANNVKILKPFLQNHLPEIIYLGKHDNLEIMISECLGIDSFFSSYILNKKPISFYYNIWENVLLNIMEMWKNSKSNDYNSKLNPRNNLARIERIQKGVLNSNYNGYSINSLMHLKTIINGVQYLSLKETFDEINKITDPEFGVVCHGDPQPSNIIISENNSWYFVDWEWSGKNHDYRLMFSHLYGWWCTRLLNIKTNPVLKIINNKLIINYDIIPDDNVKKFQKMSLKMLKSFFTLCQNDYDDINRFLALLYLGDIRFLTIWDKKEYLPVLIGEAIKTVSFIKNNRLPVDSFFTIKGDNNDGFI